jgi:hypothetical protein
MSCMLPARPLEAASKVSRSARGLFLPPLYQVHFDWPSPFDNGTSKQIRANVPSQEITEFRVIPPRWHTVRSVPGTATQCRPPEAHDGCGLSSNDLSSRTMAMIATAETTRLTISHTHQLAARNDRRNWREPSALWLLPSGVNSVNSEG